MTKKQLHNPHDKLFRASMQYPQVAREFLELHLPVSIKKYLDFNSIVTCPNSFIDKDLKLLQSDVLLKAMVLNQETYFYILAEHQKKPDQLMAFRLMEYMIKIWDLHIKEKGKKHAIPFPVIVPLVFFTGAGRYNAPMTLWALFGDHAESMRRILQSPYLLIDANTIPEEQLTSRMWSGTMEFIMRNRFKQHPDEEIQKIAGNLNHLIHEKDRQLVLELLSYIVDIDDEHRTIQDFIGIIHDLSPDVEEEIMGLAAKIKDEGKIESKIEIARSMLSDGVEPVFVAKHTGLSLTKIQGLKKKL